ncbi:hypothetical protein LRAMOSA00203 [Lichtheimia ramosa]|uniref:Thioesterase n=1 Tax=Lichtheimia ramosa TaxID=688394 RepID=A0A077W8G9_9FUNG|nr:hypothetical protein LRAMOSA00203 [Lichtheimia ramosa]
MAPTTAAIGIPALIMLLAHYKSLPLAYTFRSWWLLRSLVKQAKAKNLEPEPLFGVVSQDHKVLFDDMDYNQHMNNGMYNKVLDFGRIHLLYAIFPRVMMEPGHQIFCHNAGVVTLFRKEIKPLSKYVVQSRVWTWNKKWFWLQHRFILPDGTVACLCVSKLVFKKTSGKTIPPAEIFQLCGHDMSDLSIEERRQKNWELAEGLLKLDALNNDTYSWDELQVLPHAKL